MVFDFDFDFLESAKKAILKTQFLPVFDHLILAPLGALALPPDRRERGRRPQSPPQELEGRAHRALNF